MKRFITSVLTVVAMFALVSTASATVDVRDVTSVAGNKFDAYFTNSGTVPPGGFTASQQQGTLNFPSIFTEFNGASSTSPRWVLVTYIDEFTSPTSGTLLNTFEATTGASVTASVRSFIKDGVTVTTTSDVSTVGGTSTVGVTMSTPYLIGNQLLLYITGNGTFNVQGSAQIIQAVPEPATLVLWGSFGAMTLAGLVIKRRRNRAAA